MGEIIAVASGKGGVGKSSIVLNLGEMLGNMDKKVCLIDMDLGLKNLDYMMGLENRVLYDLKDVMEGHCSLRKAMLQDKYCRNVYLIPACKSVQIHDFSKEQLKLIVEELAGQFDYVFLDAPAGIEKGFACSMYCVDQVIVVTTLDVTALQDADRIIGILMQEGKEEISFLVNRYSPKAIEKKIAIPLEDAKRWLAVEFLGYVFEDEEMRRAGNIGKPAVIKRNQPVYECFMAIAKRLQGEYVNLPKLHKESFLSKLFG
ncbi:MULTISPECIES: septum site-determining protein MinD [Bacillota]|jgi:septum site-determining protein MinD|uniref:Septum site-determining protein MinD n=2 Tax=Amedibacillus TaxID=2749846 RepID=A0A7G9GL70_9FIRM|nr:MULTISPECIES: septum site-determining protein MinD [Bacillota]QNM11552.1 septum site-determining protein MinD [[Eubacterium] hominis]MCH4285204.1 septum site-determining protein MinD [Amedibacillus hominis]RGB56228.1 septum site-determining protein MinD [Absiella sp. AM22-9]RGB61991.1 septum site-determining protein MinD [Absiella sp. AM10-20]RGB70187.1 septum site-determining protein MinD [Absiella sp. AM09-45]